LVKVTFSLTGIIAVTVAVLAPALVRIYLGPDFAPAAIVVRVIVFGTIPYCLFLLLSHIIDAFHRNSLTAVIEIVAFFVASIGCCIVWFSGRSLVGFLIAFMSGI